MTLDSTLTELEEVRKSFRPILAVKGVSFEWAEGLLGIPGRLNRGQIKIINRDIPPRVARTMRPGLPSLCRMEIRGLT